MDKKTLQEIINKIDEHIEWSRIQESNQSFPRAYPVLNHLKEEILKMGAKQ